MKHCDVEAVAACIRVCQQLNLQAHMVAGVETFGELGFSATSPCVVGLVS